MRILFTTTAGSGHFHPLVPLAQAAVAAGHAVACAASPSLRHSVEAARLRFFPAGFDRRGVPLDDLFPAMRSLTGLALGKFVREIRVNIEARQMAPDLLHIASDWIPDLLVRESSEYGGCVAAEVLGIPHASVRTAYTTSSYGLRHVVSDALTALRADHGLPPDPDGVSPFRYLHLAFEPPGFWPADEPLAPTYHLLRPVIFDRSGGEGLPPWVASLPPVPTVCATLGTFMNRSTDVFTAILEGLRDEEINLILAVGRDIDPSQFGREWLKGRGGAKLPGWTLLSVPAAGRAIIWTRTATIVPARNAIAAGRVGAPSRRGRRSRGMARSRTSKRCGCISRG